MTTLLRLSDIFAPLSNEIIVHIFKFVTKTAGVGPFGTFFENILTLCQFRLISKRMRSILTTDVICTTLFKRDQRVLMNNVGREKEYLGLISLSRCNSYYCVYTKNLFHLSPVLRENPMYSREGSMKLYPMLSVIACCIRKYYVHQNWMKFYLKKFQNQRKRRLTLINVTTNNYDGLLHLTRLPPPPPITKTLQCDVTNCSAKKRLFCEQGLKDHKEAMHSNVM